MKSLKTTPVFEKYYCGKNQYEKQKQWEITYKSWQIVSDKNYCLGQTEMWYVFDTELSSNLIYRFKENISKKQLAEVDKARFETLIICEGSVTVNGIDCNEGETLLVPAYTEKLEMSGNAVILRSYL